MIYWLEHNIEFGRCKEWFEYHFEGAKHRYYPDFIFPTGEYVEVKGAERSVQWKAKLCFFPKNKKLIVIGIHEIGKYLDYVESKYGKNFIDIYEKKRIVKRN